MAILGTLLWLSLNIYYEARSEDRNSQIAIAQVTINRSKDSNLTVKEVVLQPNQFSWTKDRQKRKGNVPKDPKVFAVCVESALIAMSSSDITGGATHFHEKRVHPAWAKNMHYTKTFGKHKYYKPKKSDAAIAKVKQYQNKHISVLSDKKTVKLIRKNKTGV